MTRNKDPGMKIHKSFVKTNNTASIRCPSCSRMKNIAVGKFRNVIHTLKTRCSCNCNFLVSLDFRRHYRKPTNITGTYSLIDAPSPGGGSMQVINISRSGIGFSISGIHAITVGQKALLTFQLDDRKQTELSKQVIVRSVMQNTIGCEFIDHSQFEKDLGFYLQH